MAAVQAPLYSATGSSKGHIDVPEAIFGGMGSLRTLQEVVVGLQGNQRRGTSSTKTRGLVSGGGRKPWKQKGTGNARSGSIRSPLWRKGGIIFGPLPRSHRTELTQAKRVLALQTALATKLKAEGLGILDSIQIGEPKTGEAQAVLDKAGLAGRRVLLVVEKRDEKIERAFRNLKDVRLVEPGELNAWMLMASGKILFTKAALDALIQRWPKG